MGMYILQIGLTEDHLCNSCFLFSRELEYCFGCKKAIVAKEHQPHARTTYPRDMSMCPLVKGEKIPNKIVTSSDEGQYKMTLLIEKVEQQ